MTLIREACAFLVVFVILPFGTLVACAAFGQGGGW